MALKSLLISVDATAETDAPDVQLEYSDEEDGRDDFSTRSKNSTHDVDANLFRKSQTKKNLRDEKSDDVNFNVVLNSDSFEPPNVRRYSNPRYTGTGCHISQRLGNTDVTEAEDENLSFLNSEEGQERRLARAKRFGQSIPSPPPQADQADIEELYDYFGIDLSNKKNLSKFRLNAVHVRGINEFSTQNIFDYFDRYKPRFVEWVNDAGCNVTWDKKSEAAAALIGLSKPVKLLQKRDHSASSDQDDDEDFVSPLKRGREPPLSADQDVDHEMVPGPDVSTFDLSEDSARSRHSEVITVDTSRHLVPPMFVWRAGHKTGSTLPHSQLILMRFATLDDVKSSKSERQSEFYKTHGNPNFGHMTGLISRSKKRRLRDAEFNGEEEGGEFFDVRSRLKQRRHEAPLDLRTRIKNSSRWQEIRASSRRWSDDEDEGTSGPVKRPGGPKSGSPEDGELSPYSDLDEPVRNTIGKRVKKPIRMQMRADDVERKQTARRRQNAALFGAGDQRQDDEDDGAQDEGYWAPTTEAATKRGLHGIEVGYDEKKSDNEEESKSGQSPVDVRERLKKYRMKITVDNDGDDSESSRSDMDF